MLCYYFYSGCLKVRFFFIKAKIQPGFKKESLKCIRKQYLCQKAEMSLRYFNLNDVEYSGRTIPSSSINEIFLPATSLLEKEGFWKSVKMEAFLVVLTGYRSTGGTFRMLCYLPSPFSRTVTLVDNSLKCYLKKDQKKSLLKRFRRKYLSKNFLMDGTIVKPVLIFMKLNFPVNWFNCFFQAVLDEKRLKIHNLI